MNFLFPERRALCMAENATHNLHNVLTLRGALVRDAHVWARLPRRGDRAVRRATPTSSSPAPLAALGARADRRLPRQAARPLRLHPRPDAAAAEQGPRCRARSPRRWSCPPGLEREWHCRGYYGSLNHNVKAVYQRYLGWFDGNPAHLWPHPPQAAGRALRRARRRARTRCSQSARRAFDEGDYRWVAEVVNHLVFADPDNAEAKELQARALEQLAFGAENATWRNFFLMGALELREGVTGSAATLAPDVLAGALDEPAPRRDRDPDRRAARRRDEARDALVAAGHRRGVPAGARERRAHATARDVRPRSRCRRPSPSSAAP